MIRDRLSELKEVSCSLNASTESLVIIDSDDVEEYLERSVSPAMDELLRMYHQILHEFDIISANIEAMKIMTQAKNFKEFNEQDFYNLRQNTVQIGNTLISKFQSIRTTLSPEDDFSTLARMQRFMYYGLFENYVIIWSKNEEFLQEYESNVKKNLKMQSKILNYDLTEEEIDTLIAHKVTTLYSGNILETEQALNALKDGLGELRKLETSIEEVHSLFIRLQILVADQGVTIQRIETHFNDCRDHVAVAAQEFRKAEHIKNKNRKTIEIHSSSSDLRNYEVAEEEQDVELDYKPYNGPVGHVLKKYLHISEQLKDIENHLLKMKSMTSAEQMSNFNQKDFNKIRNESIKIGNDIIKKFKKLESKLPEADDFSALARMKRLLYFGFFQQYVIVWTKNEKFLMDFEQKLKKKLQMQSQILNCNLTDDEIETLIENKNTNLFISNILQDTETERKTLHELQGRFEDLKKLEKSITEVHNLFISLQTLVAEQGDAIQRIETHFDATRHYVEEANKQIQMAVEIKKKRCCRFCCL